MVEEFDKDRERACYNIQHKNELDIYTYIYYIYIHMYKPLYVYTLT